MFKLFVVLALFAVASAQLRNPWRPVDDVTGRPGAPDARCPQREYRDDENAVTVPGDSCTTFRKCQRGWSFPYDCPAGLHYNAALGVCDYSESANCAGNRRWFADEEAKKL